MFLDHRATGAETDRRGAARGETVTWDLDDPWRVERREQAALGKRVERVRIVDEPATPGRLRLLDNARRDTAVGETIRVSRRADAEELPLPAEDFWIFDSRVAALLAFDQDDNLTGIGARAHRLIDRARAAFDVP